MSETTTRPPLEEIFPCLARCYPATRPHGQHSNACRLNRAYLADAVREWLTGQRDDIAVIIATISGGTHEPDAHDGDGDDWRIEADAVLDLLTGKADR